MLVHLLRTKLLRAEVTAARLDYEGSLAIDRELMALVGMLPYEKILIGNLANGERFETYAIPGGTGDVCLNGAAARLVQPGDRIIVITYGDYDEAELEAYEPRVVHVDASNRPVDEASASELAALEVGLRA